jgi:SAM-dependent methyltransferase
MNELSPALSSIGSRVAWHDAECGAYGADLPVWERAAERCGGPILDLGAGSGRVALHLARRGHRVVAVDSDPELIEALGARAAAQGLPVTAINADVRSFERITSFGLIIAPMQLVHLLGGPAGRRRMLRAVAASLRGDGEFYAALLDDPLPPLGSPAPDDPAPLPDVREIDGWIHSSLPVEIRVDDEAIAIERLRQLVSPEGRLTEKTDVVVLDRLTPDALESEARACGLEPMPRLPIVETDSHVGSVIARMRRVR